MRCCDLDGTADLPFAHLHSDPGPTWHHLLQCRTECHLQREPLTFCASDYVPLSRDV